MRPCLLALIWGSPLSLGFPVEASILTVPSVVTDFMQKVDKYLMLYLHWSPRFASVHLIYSESRFVGRPQPASSQLVLSLGMLSDTILMAP